MGLFRKIGESLDDATLKASQKMDELKDKIKKEMSTTKQYRVGDFVGDKDEVIQHLIKKGIIHKEDQ